MHYQLKIDSQDFVVEVVAEQAGSLRVSVNGTPFDVVIQKSDASARQEAVDISPRRPAPKMAVSVAPAQSACGAAPVAGAVLAPIPGLIVEVKVHLGEVVQAGQTVAVMEAMKMENNLTTHFAGVVKEILVQKGSEVSTGDVILHIG
jgi:biotin carboxyl carrier protein